MITMDDDSEQPEPIDPKEIPEFRYYQNSMESILQECLLDFSILIIYNLIFFISCVFKFIKYDVR